LSFSSCSTSTSAARSTVVNLAPAELVRIERLPLADIKKISQNGINPYIAKKSIIFKNDELFYVFRLSFLPADSMDIRLVSSSLTDEGGATIAASAETVEALRVYWSKYIMPDDDRTVLQAIIDSTYLKRVNFAYSSKKERQWILVFIGNGSEPSQVIASFNFEINNQPILIEVK